MNALFVGKKMRMRATILHLWSTPSPLLKQAAHLLNGLYLQPASPTTLTQYLMMYALSDNTVQGMLRIPSAAEQVDFSTTCFCHHKPIQLGFTCPVCLSVFCKKKKFCTTCNSEFELRPGSAPAIKKKKTTTTTTTTGRQ